MTVLWAKPFLTLSTNGYVITTIWMIIYWRLILLLSLLNKKMRCIFWSMIKRAANMRNRNCMLVQLLQVPQYKVWWIMSWVSRTYVRQPVKVIFIIVLRQSVIADSIWPKVFAKRTVCCQSGKDWIWKSLHRKSLTLSRILMYPNITSTLHRSKWG